MSHVDARPSLEAYRQNIAVPFTALSESTNAFLLPCCRELDLGTGWPSAARVRRAVLTLGSHVPCGGPRTNQQCCSHRELSVKYFWWPLGMDQPVSPWRCHCAVRLLLASVFTGIRALPPSLTGLSWDPAWWPFAASLRSFAGAGWRGEVFVLSSSVCAVGADLVSLFQHNETSDHVTLSWRMMAWSCMDIYCFALFLRQRLL